MKGCLEECLFPTHGEWRSSIAENRCLVGFYRADFETPSSIYKHRNGTAAVLEFPSQLAAGAICAGAELHFFFAPFTRGNEEPVLPLHQNGGYSYCEHGKCLN